MDTINLNLLNYSFKNKPLLIGGKAMEYYKLRKAGDDIDFVISSEDYNNLSKLYPNKLKDIYGDLGVIVYGFELWTSICLFDFDFLSQGSIEKYEYRIISLEKLLFLKALGIDEEKYEKDVRLIVKKILNIQYGKDKLPD